MDPQTMHPPVFALLCPMSPVILILPMSYVCVQGEVFEVAASVQVKNSKTGQSCYVSSFGFLEQHSIFGDEVRTPHSSLLTSKPSR